MEDADLWVVSGVRAAGSEPPGEPAAGKGYACIRGSSRDSGCASVSESGSGSTWSQAGGPRGEAIGGGSAGSPIGLRIHATWTAERAVSVGRGPHLVD